jgi:hypothetical protein
MNHLLTGDRSQGGGTITMQLTREFFLTREKTYIRKIREIFLAFRIERRAEQAGDPDALSEQDIPRQSGLRRGRGRAGLLRGGCPGPVHRPGGGAGGHGAAALGEQPASGTQRVVDRRNYVSRTACFTSDWITEAAIPRGRWRRRWSRACTDSCGGAGGAVCGGDGPGGDPGSMYGAEAYVRGLRVVTSGRFGESQEAATRCPAPCLARAMTSATDIAGPLRTLELGEESGGGDPEVG